ncbi:MAG: aminopeptidase P family N-terminal domain-containing protein [Desulfofustis sp.]
MSELRTQEITATELGGRIERLQLALQEKGIDGALIVQKTDLFYFSATSQQGYLYVPGVGQPLLMVFKDFDRARRESPLEQVVSIGSPRTLPDILASRGLASPALLGLELDVLPAKISFQ